MKDPIVDEIHRRRAAYAKRFNYDARAIGKDIRQCELASKGKFAAIPVRNQNGAVSKHPKTVRRK